MKWDNAQMLRHDAQNRMVFSDPLSLLPGEGPGPASSEWPFCKSRATAEVPVDTPFTQQALVLPEASAGWLNHRAAGVRASFRHGSRRVFLKGTFSKWLVPQLLGQLAHSATSRVEEQGSSCSRDAPTGEDAAERRFKEERGCSCL